MENLSPDPLLKPGAFIDLTFDNGYLHSNFASDPTDVSDPNLNPYPKPIHQPDPSTPVHNSSTSEAAAQGNLMNADPEVPDWLPPGWEVQYRVRTSGASAGHRDKYYYHSLTKHRFRSKKEVLSFLETGEIGSKKKRDGPDAESTPPSNKRKKTAPKVSMENFKFNEVPEKVKWVLTDVYEGSWRPLVDGVDRVPESAKQEWAAAFRYLSLQKINNVTASLT